MAKQTNSTINKRYLSELLTRTCADLEKNLDQHINNQGALKRTKNIIAEIRTAINDVINDLPTQGIISKIELSLFCATIAEVINEYKPDLLKDTNRGCSDANVNRVQRALEIAQQEIQREFSLPEEASITTKYSLPPIYACVKTGELLYVDDDPDKGIEIECDDTDATFMHVKPLGVPTNQDRRYFTAFHNAESDAKEEETAEVAA